MKYRVVRIDNGQSNPHTGIVSQHRTLETAERAIQHANKSLRRQRGYETSWHPYAIESLVDGAWGRV